jgi:hypothetical protein
MEIVRNWEPQFKDMPKSWSKVIKRDATQSSERGMPRVVKEYNEAAPIIDRLVTFIRENEQQLKQQPCTIIDLCSGFGIMGMLFAELLPAHLVDRIVLVDNMWPMGSPKQGADKPTSSQISWDHIYEKNWPIKLTTHKRNLKKGRELQSLEQRVLSHCKGPICVCAVHLCGSLSLRAAQIYNNNPGVAFFALKPCCLPGGSHARQKMLYQAGNHSFSAEELYGSKRPDKTEKYELNGQKGPDTTKKDKSKKKDKGKKDKGMGARRFARWNDHLLQCLICSDEDKSLQDVVVQQKHFQVSTATPSR